MRSTDSDGGGGGGGNGSDGGSAGGTAYGLDVDLEVDVLVADGDTLDEALANLPWDANDIVAVGSGHLGADNRVFLGTTAARILRWTTAPVIVVPKESTPDTETTDTESTTTKAQGE